DGRGRLWGVHESRRVHGGVSEGNLDRLYRPIEPGLLEGSRKAQAASRKGERGGCVAAVACGLRLETDGRHRLLYRRRRFLERRLLIARQLYFQNPFQPTPPQLARHAEIHTLNAVLPL